MKKFLFLCLSISACSQFKTIKENTGTDYIQKSIAYHDPDGKWSHAAMKLIFQEADSARPHLKREVSLINETSEFIFFKIDDENELQYAVEGDSCNVLFNGRRDFSKKDANEYRLTCDRGHLLKDFYTNLYGFVHET